MLRMLHPKSIREFVITASPSLSGNYMYSDNMPLITEHVAGNLYTIHTSGDDTVRTTSGGYWRLSHVECAAATRQFSLTTLAARSVAQSTSNCHPQRSGTVHVSASNKIEFYCHERNVVRSLFENKEECYFKRGTAVSYVSSTRTVFVPERAKRET
jgi:hypothetical protein